MKTLIYHWSGGSYLPNACDKAHYHFIVDEKGKVWNGIFKPEDNEFCKDNKYAAHTGGGNTSAIGIAFSGMFGFTNRFSVGIYPLTFVQCEAGFELGAKLALQYGINLNLRHSVQTHYGFGKRNPKTSSKGKIDIVYLPPYPTLRRDEIENFISRKVLWYFEKLKKTVV